MLWHFGLSGKNRNSLERVQKSALRVILGKKYTSYSNALKELNIDSLQERRESLCIKFAKKCLKVNKLRKMFPKKFTMHEMSKRNFEYFRVNKTLTNRYLNSAIPQMQRMLNKEKKKEVDTLNKFVVKISGISTSTLTRY